MIADGGKVVDVEVVEGGKVVDVEVIEGVVVDAVEPPEQAAKPTEASAKQISRRRCKAEPSLDRRPS